MTLIHTPAHTSFHPDVVTDDETGQQYLVVQDADAEDPRVRVDDGDVALYKYCVPSLGDATDDVPENIAAQAFARYYDAVSDAKALELTRRYLRAYHPEQKIAVAISTIRGYNQGDWADVFCAVAEGYGTPDDYIDEFRMWKFGDVWTVIPDGKTGISGIYADGPESAVELYRKDFEDPGFAHTIQLIVNAPDAAASLAKVEQIVQAIHESDALPQNVRVRAYTTADTPEEIRP